MADELRSCRRTGCRGPSAASLSYRYDSRQVWLLDMVEESHPSLYDLCPHHADHMTVPRGWDLVDQRTAPPVIVEPAAEDRVPERIPEHLRAPADRHPHPHQFDRSPARRDVRNQALRPRVEMAGRYAALTADLPRLAASLADHPDLQPPGSDPDPHHRCNHGVPLRPRQAAREMVQVRGQLAIPVDDLPPLGGPSGAVVVSIQRAGGRRREARHHET